AAYGDHAAHIPAIFTHYFDAFVQRKSDSFKYCPFHVSSIGVCGEPDETAPYIRIIIRCPFTKQKRGIKQSSSACRRNLDFFHEFIKRPVITQQLFEPFQTVSSRQCYTHHIFLIGDAVIEIMDGTVILIVTLSLGGEHDT